MFFPLLEALIQKNPNLCKYHIHEFLQSDEDISAIYKALFTYSSQHAVSESPDIDALVVSDCLSNVLRTNSKNLSLSQRTMLLEEVIEYLCSIPVATVDTTVLKPSMDKATVVSISDLEESFDQDHFDRVIESVRDLLTLMDNKHYFMEIIYRIVLHKSPQSIVLASATSRAIEIMGWRNNFTPFLIYHLVTKMFDDKIKVNFSEEDSIDNRVFEQSMSRLKGITDCQFLSASYRIYEDCKILASKIKPMVAARLRNYFNSNEERIHPSTAYSEIERMVNQSCMDDLSKIKGAQSFL